MMEVFEEPSSADEDKLKQIQIIIAKLNTFARELDNKIEANTSALEEKETLLPTIVEFVDDELYETGGYYKRCTEELAVETTCDEWETKHPEIKDSFFEVRDGDYLNVIDCRTTEWSKWAEGLFVNTQHINDLPTIFNGNLCSLLFLSFRQYFLLFALLK